MARKWNEADFESVYDDHVVGGRFQEDPSYYPRYKARYHTLLKRYAEMAPEAPQDILDIGGGQFSVMCKFLWGDRAQVADIEGPHFQYLEEVGVTPTHWNLCTDPEPYKAKFDFVFFSEVIEHLPIPSHLVLEKLKRSLRPNGVIICTTPNLHRLRNVVFLLTGRKVFDYFRMPTDQGLGHMLEFTSDHLQWQFNHAGLADVKVEHVQMFHSPKNPVMKVMYWLGSPLFLIPLYRDYLLAIGRKTA